VLCWKGLWKINHFTLAVEPKIHPAEMKFYSKFLVLNFLALWKVKIKTLCLVGVGVGWDGVG
jgi:hypothetical protein